MTEVQTITNEELAVLAKQGDQSAVSQLWEQVRRFALKIAQRYLPRDGSSSLQKEDFENAGFIAMTDAVQGFDPAAGCTFSTYFAFHLQKQFRELRGWRHQHPDPLDAPGTESLDAALPGVADHTVADLIPDAAAEQAFEDATDRISTEQRCAVVLQCMKRLEPRQANIIRQHYLDGLTLRELAAQAGTAVESVRQHERAGISRLLKFREIRKLAAEIYADRRTNFYLHVGVQSFQSSGMSAVERIAEKRDRQIGDIRCRLVAKEG